MSDDLGISETTRRQLLERAAVGAAAVTVLGSPAIAKARPRPTSKAAPPGPRNSPAPSAPVGPTSPYVTYQSEIYVAGMSADTKPIFTTNLSDLEAVAEEVLSPEARQYLVESAGGARAARLNERAHTEWRIVPRMFIDREERDLSTEILGTEMPAPVILGPVGRQELFHREAEDASARAAAGLELTYVHSEHASRPVESIAASAPQGSRWFGFDWPDWLRGDEPDLGLLQRAQRAGCTHLVLSPPQPGEGWLELAAIRNAWSGPILLSGIQTPRDARKAVRRGFDGVVVSNERGRRGTRPRGTLHALPRVVDAVGGKVPVLFGSGARTGTDVFKALALGAEAVIIGRPYVYGLALRGEAGIRHMLRTLLAELDIAFAIAADSGKLDDLDPDALVRS